MAREEKEIDGEKWGKTKKKKKAKKKAVKDDHDSL